jgi:hypothetical protein
MIEHELDVLLSDGQVDIAASGAAGEVLIAGVFRRPLTMATSAFEEIAMAAMTPDDLVRALIREGVTAADQQAMDARAQARRTEQQAFVRPAVIRQVAPGQIDWSFRQEPGCSINDECVVPKSTDERGTRTGRSKTVLAVIASEVVTVTGAVDPIVSGPTCEGPLADDRVVAHIAVDGVASASAVDVVVADLAIDGVAVGAAIDGVVTCAAVDDGRSVTGLQHVIASAAFDVVAIGARSDDVPIVAADHVVAAVPGIDRVAITHRWCGVAGVWTCADEIMARSRVDAVIALERDDDVVSVGAGDPVVTRSADDRRGLVCACPRLVRVSARCAGSDAQQ